MLMLSSSSTWPPSSRPTMPSSSLSAFSKLKSLISRCLVAGLAISRSIMLRPSGPGLHQRPDVYADGPGQGGEVVAPFEHGNQPAVRLLGGDFRNFVRGPAEVGLGQAQVCQRVVGVGIEAGRDQHE